MIKENKKMLLITLGIILLPIIMGLLLWNQLPDTVVTHWGANNQPDGYSSKGFAVIGLPAILYIILGNFIPKIKQNYTIGFRVSWALNDADNWFNTHRFGGKCMVIGGIILIITSPLKNMWIIIAAAIIPCILPAVYSYMYYRKKL